MPVATRVSPRSWRKVRATLVLATHATALTRVQTFCQVVLIGYPGFRRDPLVRQAPRFSCIGSSICSHDSSSHDGRPWRLRHHGETERDPALLARRHTADSNVTSALVRFVVEVPPRTPPAPAPAAAPSGAFVLCSWAKSFVPRLSGKRTEMSLHWALNMMGAPTGRSCATG